MSDLQPLPCVSRYDDRTLIDALDRAARQYGSCDIVHVSPSDASEDIQTFAELRSESRAVAELLLSKGWRPGQHLIFVVASSRLFVTTFWGCLIAGIVPVPLAQLSGRSLDSAEAEKIRNVVGMIKAPVLFDSRQDSYASLMEELVTGAGSRLVFADEVVREAALGNYDAPDLPVITETDNAVLQFSSGSSGLPKGVRLTHRNIVANIEGQLDATHVKPGDVLCTWLPYFHDFGLFWGHLSALYHGMKQVRIDPGHFARRPLLWLEKLDKHKANITNTTPTALEHLVGHMELKQRKGPLGPYDLTNLKEMLVGAEMVDPRICRRAVELLKPFGVPDELICVGYGLTETTVAATAVPPGTPLPTRVIDRTRLVTTGEIVEVAPDDEQAAEFAAVGVPVTMCDIRIVDDGGQPVGIDQAGIVEIRGEHVTPGYLDNEEANRTSFHDGWFSTGDIGFLDDKGFLYITGRAKEMIIVGGHNYFPWDIEQIALKALDDSAPVIKFVTICGFWNPERRREEIALFFVQERVPEERVVQALRTMAERVNAVAGFPIDSFVRLQTREIPRTSSGKVMRRVLSDMVLTGKLQRYAMDAAATEPAPERSRRRRWSEQELRDLLRSLWSDALNVPAAEIGPDSSLFHLGCNSIKASDIQGRLEEALHQRLETNFNYAHPVLEDQVQHLLTRDLTVTPPETEFELILRTVVHDVLGIPEHNIGVTHPLSKLAPGFAEAARLHAEIARVFALKAEEAQALKGNTIRELAAELTSSMGIGQSDGNPFPLMNFQETLYFHRKGFVRNEPSRLSCFIFISLDIEGDIRVERLNEAFNLVIRKAPMMRAIVDESQDRPHLRILDEVPRFEVVHRELTGMTAEEEDAFLTERGRDLNDVRFDIAQWPLFLCELYRRGDGRYALLFNIDHLLIDGYSFMHLLEEVFKAYDALTEGKLFDATPYGLQFRDYVLIEQIRQRTQSYRKAMEYQLSLYQNLPPKALLPFKCDPAAIEDVWFDTYYHKLPPEMVERLIEVAGRQEVTLNSLLLGIWFKIVNLWSNQEDLIINMPVFNREQYFAGARSVIGTFIDIFPIRVKTNGTEPVLSIARKVERFTRELLSVPVSSIELSRLIAERDEYSAGSMSSLIFSNSIGVYGGEIHALKHMKVNEPWFRTGAPGTFIDLVLYDYGGEYYINWNYIRDLMDHDFVVTLADQFQAICRQLTEETAAGTAFSAVDLLPSEFRRMVSGLNDASVDYPISTIQAEVAAQVRRTPDATALTFGDTRVGYAELLERANRVANLLRREGVDKDKFVAIMFDRSIDMLVAQLGVLQAGGAYVPIDPEYPSERIAYVLNDCRAQVLLLQERFLDRVPQGTEHLETLILTDGAGGPTEARRVLGSADIAAMPTDAPAEPAGPDNLAYMIYTSGSTGQPKGVMIRHRNILNFLHWVRDYYGLGETDEVAFVTSYAFDMTLATNWTPLMSGSRLHILDEPSTRDVETLLQFLSDRRITFLNVTPSHFSLISSARAHLDLGDLPMAPNMRIMLGGEVINTKDLNNWLRLYPTHRFINEYGPTEVSVASTYYPIPVNAEGLVDIDVVPIGKPLYNNRIYVLDRAGQPCMPNVAGELCLGGVGVAVGYFNKPERTEKAFVPDPFVGGDAMMYRTGDMARIWPDGNVEFLGREDHQINLRGYRIEAGEVESAMREHPRVTQAVVVAQPDAAGQLQLVGFYTATGGEVPAAELRDTIGAHLPAHMIPAQYMMLDAMPTTPSGKLDHKALPRVRVAATDEGYVAPRTEMERRVAALWCEVLGIDRAGAHDNFWDLGGNSLSAMRLIIGYRDAGLHGFGLRDVFQYGSVAETAAFFEKGARPGNDTDDILSVLRSDANAKARILLLPFACGNASSFVDLARHLDGECEIVAANPADPADETVLDIATLGDRIIAALSTRKPGLPLFIVGYSYGGYLAYDIARKLEIAARSALGVAIVASTPPGVRTEVDMILKASDEEILAYSRDLYGFDPARLSAEETQRYLHLLREQTRSMGVYRFDMERKLSTPALFLVGEEEEDKELAQEMGRWHDLFRHGTSDTLAGRHMLIKTHPEQLAARLNDLVGPTIDRLSASAAE